jgi:triphosphoribosyl-dephospho-CoA synthase
MGTLLATTPALDANTLAEAVLQACLQEVNAFKPGNVSPEFPAHDMSAEDFKASAKAISSAMTLPQQSVGQRILAGIRATRQVTQQNTNLGIVLLFAPLISACYRTKPLQFSLSGVLQELTVEDAAAAYQAIALANPGGLGQHQAHDVHQPATISLLEAMVEAQDTDQIARAYATHYHWFWHVGLPLWQCTRQNDTQIDAAILQLYLAILAREPDSHIVRRHGMAVAQQVSAQAAALQGGKAPHHALVAWDSALKAARINPGTTADLVATVLFMDSLLNPQG